MYLSKQFLRSKNEPSVSGKHQFHFALRMILITATLIVLSGCTLMPLRRFQPVIAPPSTNCTPPESSFLPEEQMKARTNLYYVLATNAGLSDSFDHYYTTTQTAVRAKLPASLQQHKVTNAFMDFMLSAVGEAQLDAQIADQTVTDSATIIRERDSIKKHSGPTKLSHRDLKDFADKLFDLQLKPSSANLVGEPANRSALSVKGQQFLDNHAPLDKTFVQYFEAYYGGNFVDRMGTKLDKPQISTTVPDSEIVAAETVLIEFLMDTIDPTPVMGDAASGSINSSTTFYPGNSKNKPTVLVVNPGKYVQIIAGTPTTCGITTQNVWVLRDLANGASAQASAVGGLVANTPGGISFGLGVLGKISIGDNQTLSVMVKTAASRIALRATLASSYWTLRHVKFNVSEPGS